MKIGLRLLLLLCKVTDSDQKKRKKTKRNEREKIEVITNLFFVHIFSIYSIRCAKKPISFGWNEPKSIKQRPAAGGTEAMRVKAAAKAATSTAVTAAVTLAAQKWQQQFLIRRICLSKWRTRKKARKKNCHVNGNFEIESIIILLLTSSWLPFVVYNKIIKKMWKERPNRIGFTLLFNRIETIFNAFIEQIIKNSIENTNGWASIYLRKKGPCAAHSNAMCLTVHFFVSVHFFYVSLAEN